MIWLTNWKFLNYIFLGKIVQRNVSGIILCREEAIAS